MDNGYLYYSISTKTIQIMRQYHLTLAETQVFALIDCLSRSGLCRISQRNMADVTGLSRQAINAAIAKLVQLRLVLKLQEYQHGYVTEYAYQATVHCIDYDTS